MWCGEGVKGLAPYPSKVNSTKVYFDKKVRDSLNPSKSICEMYIKVYTMGYKFGTHD